MASPIRGGLARCSALRSLVVWNLSIHLEPAGLLKNVIFCSSTKAYMTACRLDVKYLYLVEDFGLGRLAPAFSRLQGQLLTPELEVPKHVILS